MSVTRAHWAITPQCMMGAYPTDMVVWWCSTRISAVNSQYDTGANEGSTKHMPFLHRQQQSAFT